MQSDNNTFKVNDFTTIFNFTRLGIFEDFMKFGYPSTYEKFTGEIDNKKIEGFICLKDNNIYNLKYI